MVSMKDCAKSLSYLRPLKEGGYLSEKHHDRIVAAVRRDINKNGGVDGLVKEGRRKRMQRGGYDPQLPPSAPGQLQSLMQAMTPPTQQGVTTNSPVFSVGGYNGKHPDNEPYGMHDEESLNWHQRAGFRGMYPEGSYDAGSPQGRQPAVVHEVHRTYSTDLPMGRLFESAPGVSEGTVNRLRDALMGAMKGR